MVPRNGGRYVHSWLISSPSESFRKFIAQVPLDLQACSSHRCTESHLIHVMRCPCQLRYTLPTKATCWFSSPQLKNRCYHYLLDVAVAAPVHFFRALVRGSVFVGSMLVKKILLAKYAARTAYLHTKSYTKYENNLGSDLFIDPKSHRYV